MTTFKMKTYDMHKYPCISITVVVMSSKLISLERAYNSGLETFIPTQPFMACKGPLGVNSGGFSESCVSVRLSVCVRLLLLNGNGFSRGFRGATWAQYWERPCQLLFSQTMWENVSDKKLYFSRYRVHIPTLKTLGQIASEI